MNEAEGISLTEHQRCWLKHVQACEASGKRITEYATENGQGVRAIYEGKRALVKKGILPRTRASRFQRARVVDSVVSSEWRIQLPNGVAQVSRYLVKDFGTSKPPKSTRKRDAYCRPSRPASVPLSHTIASSALASQHFLKWLAATGTAAGIPRSEGECCHNMQSDQRTLCTCNHRCMPFLLHKKRLCSHLANLDKRNGSVSQRTNVQTRT